MSAIVCLQCGRPVLMEHTYGDSSSSYLEIIHYSCGKCMLDREITLERDGFVRVSYGTISRMWQEVPQGCLLIFSWECV